MTQHAVPDSGLSFYLDKDGVKLLVACKAGSARDPIDKDLAGQMLVSQGFADLFIYADALEKFIKQYSSESEFTLVLGELRDGDFSLDIDADLMGVHLTITPAYGGTPITEDQIYAALQKEGITFGIHDDTIQAAVAKGYARNKLIAEGVNPTQGDNAEFISLLREVKTSRLHSDDTEPIDYRNFGNIITVKQGDPLMRRLPPAAGTPGTNIRGCPVPAAMGEDSQFSPLISGTEIQKDDPDLLIAAISGQPFLVLNGVTVEPVITIKNVDLSTGNLDIEGSLTITGDVKPGMQVKATADIVIGGMVEAAHVEAGGDIEVKGPVIGQGHPRIDDEGLNPLAAMIQAEGSMKALFVENAVVCSGGDIIISEFVMNSELSAGKSILVGEPGSNKGRIISSVCRATARIEANTIGSWSGAGTVLKVGVDPTVHEKFTLAKQTMHSKERDREEASRALEYFRAHPDRSSADTIHEKENVLRCLQTEIQELTGQLRRLKKRCTLLDSAEIKAERQIFCGVRVSIGEKTLLLENDMEAVTFTMGEQGITF
ncbi:MAG: FapA family protein [Geobacteraceae bacterium]|nr:FapA family protein [Geobacteraceae bacterium]